MICLNISKHCTCQQFDLQTATKPAVSHKHEASANGDLKCILYKTTDRSNRSLNDIMVFMKLIFYDIWTEPRSKKGSTKTFLTVYKN